MVEPARAPTSVKNAIFMVSGVEDAVIEKFYQI
jgi:hypothetical protein